MIAPNELTCPRCCLPLKQVQMSHGIFWGCGNCGGRAITIELLRRTFTPDSINPLWLHTLRHEGQNGAPCPSCQSSMLEVALSDRTKINVDVCRRCHFVWFDGREVDTLVPRTIPAAPTPLPQNAREILAIEKVKQLAEQARGSDFDSAPPDEFWKQIAACFGMPVEFDTPTKDRRPWATWTLCFAIIVASGFAFTRLHETVAQYGLIPAQAMRLHGLTFLTSFFLHAGPIHLIGNMYFLFVFGDDVENFLRPVRYLAMIALAALVGSIAHIAADPHSQIPCIGASGGIASIIVFYALKFPHVRLGFLLRWWLVWFHWIRLPAWFVFVMWFGFQLIGAWEQRAGISSVSSFAHLGGAGVGMVAWLIWRHRDGAEKQSNELTAQS